MPTRPRRHAARSRAFAAVAALCVIVLALTTSGSSNAIARSRTPKTPSGPNCGSTIRKPGGGNWTCTFDDDFTGSTLDPSKWETVLSSWSGVSIGTACLVSNNIAVSGGYLDLTVSQTSAPTTCPSASGNFSTQYSGAEVTTLSKFSQAYGRFEVRAKFPNATVPGLQASLWMLPYDLGHYGAWPASGEIDLAEMYSNWPRAPIPYIHYNNAYPDANVTKSTCAYPNPTQFHTYTVVWTTTTITISFDGQTCISDTFYPAAPLKRPQPFDTPFAITLTQALGVLSNAVQAGTPLPATTQVDYVRAWK